MIQQMTAVLCDLTIVVFLSFSDFGDHEQK